MTSTWIAGKASDVKVGDRVRAAGGELTVSRIEVAFMGIPDMVAFIEDTPERWFKQPLPLETPVEVESVS